MKNQRGQAALVMVLIMTLLGVLTISLATRSTIETADQSITVDNTQAMLVAQSGVERAIVENTAGLIQGNIDANSKYTVMQDVSKTNIYTIDSVNSGESVELDLTGLNLSGIYLYWKSDDPTKEPTVFVSDIRTNSIVDRAFNTTGEKGFTRVDQNTYAVGDSEYNYRSQIDFVSGSSKIIRIIALGPSISMAITPLDLSETLPPQERIVKSVGEVGTGSDAVKYGIEYRESKNEAIPLIFDYALFSGGSIVQ